MKHFLYIGIFLVKFWTSNFIFAEQTLNDSTHLPFGGFYCWVRCIGKCLEENMHDSIETCGNRCTLYNNDTLCTTGTCWLTCNGLIDGIQSGLDAPNSFSVSYSPGAYDPYLANLQWANTSEAALYVVQFKDTSDVFSSWSIDRRGTALTKSTNYVYRKKVLCPEFQFRVAAVNSKGVSQFSQIKTLKKPVPVVSANSKLTQITPLFYREDEWNGNRNEVLDNATVYVDLNFTTPPLWSKENISSVDLMVSHTMCAHPVYDRTVPTAQYTLDPNNLVIHVKIPATVMQQKCLQYFKLHSINSKCGTKANFPGPLISTKINCDVVKDSPCNLPKIAKRPYCTTENFECRISRSGEKCELAKLERNSTTSVNISWTMYENKFGPPLYYAVRWGPAKSAGEKVPLGLIQLLNITETKTNCDPAHLTDECQDLTSMILDEIPVDQMLGVQICAVYEKNYEFYAGRKLGFTLTTKIHIHSKDAEIKRHSTPFGVMALAICVPLGLALSFFLFVLFCLCRRQKNQKKEMERLQYEMSLREAEERYIEMPKKHDIWELDRRNLIIYSDRKLGSGAFGSVFMGKVLGHKDSMSALATNLMRVENADVAVKMLPEYADEISKGDFLKEINLMKQLGYHERLVNMMACITNSEPYCLIVEYCSDGDLLHFLRDRCKYMMKLDEFGIDYTNPLPEDNVDINLILSLKELLGLAVQCSVGMEYLSQKGFIHRDVAARNVLVHEKKYAKIGDFGLCRYVYGEDSAYWGKGGRLPIKWMSPEAIKNYEFTSKSDLWSFGVLLFEIITMGGCPYPGIQPADMEAYLEDGYRMDRPDNCPENYYKVMLNCWEYESDRRLNFSQARERLAKMLEETVEDYSYLVLNQKRDYYNVPYEQQDFMPKTIVQGNATEPSSVNSECDRGITNKAFEPIPEEKEVNSDLADTETRTNSDQTGDKSANLVAVQPEVVTSRAGFEKLINGPPVPARRRNLDSTSSIQPLITPTSASSGEVRFFDVDLQRNTNRNSNVIGSV